METFEFNTHGGVLVEVDASSITISVEGVKGWLFQRIKPRTKTISVEDVLRIDYKIAKITVGYIRVITPEIEAYPSSLYVAEHDPNGFIFQEEDMPEFNAMMRYIEAVWPKVKTTQLKL